MNINGYELVEDWSICNQGEKAIAKKGGNTYFMKKYQTPVEPVNNGALDAKTIELNKKQFKEFVDKRSRLNQTIRPLTGPGGNIIIPVQEFIYDHHYVEVSELIKGVVPDDKVIDVLKSLSLEEKILLMKTAAGALKSVHGKNIIHSDLKLKNILLVKNMSGNYVARLVDFDVSYFQGDVPEDLIGTQDYYSPEHATVAATEDEEERAELEGMMTTKTDIFSLGLVFHQYLAGEMPTVTNLSGFLKKQQDKGKIIYCWQALLGDGEIVISPKITNPMHRQLIADMLKKDYKERPTAQDVLVRLKDSGPVFESLWEEHSATQDIDKMKAAGVFGFKRVEKGGAKQYELTMTSGKTETLSLEDLAKKGFVKIVRELKFPEPWPDHAIRFNEEKLRAKGYVAGERSKMTGISGYMFFRSEADETGKFMKVDTLVMLGFAEKATGGSAPTPAPTPTPTPAPKPTPTPKPAPTPTPTPVGGAAICDPWPEHKVTFDKAVMDTKKIVKIERAAMNGVNGYNVTYGGEKTTVRFINVNMLIMQKIAKKI